MNVQVSQKNRRLWWSLFVLFSVAAAIDVIDGYWPKTIGSVSLATAFLVLAVTPFRLRWLAYIFFGITLASFAFRLASFLGGSGA